jgi:two-component system, NtrC family, response regulator HydG
LIEAPDATVEFVCGGGGGLVKPNILVIDDEESIRFTFERFLTLEGYRVMTARDCKEARVKIDEGSMDLVFADIILPDGTGVDILREIRLTQPGCPVIMITAYPSVETQRETLRIGAYDYVAKPLRQEQVMECVNRALRHQQTCKGRIGKEATEV